jgi:hypothetical protein
VISTKTSSTLGFTSIKILRVGTPMEKGKRAGNGMAKLSMDSESL